MAKDNDDGDDDDDEEPFPWHLGVFDAHCHPTDTMASIPSILSVMKARTLTIMATRSQDQMLVALVADPVHPTAHRVVPSFGWHPWFSHQLYDDGDGDGDSTSPALHTHAPDLDPDTTLQHYNAVLNPSPASRHDVHFVTQHLPPPQPLSRFLAQTRAYLEAHPRALVGEIGLDRAFRLPYKNNSPALVPSDAGQRMTPGRRNGQGLSPYRVSVQHQVRVLDAQLRLAGEMARPVSVHGVQAHGLLYDTLRATWRGHDTTTTTLVSNRDRNRIDDRVNEHFSCDETRNMTKKKKMDDGGDDEENEDENLLHHHHHHHHRQDGHEAGNNYAGRARAANPFPPRICLHSFSGSVETLRQYIDDRTCPASIFFSFSICVNFPTATHSRVQRKHAADDVIRACPRDRILVESDLHTAGQVIDDALEAMYRKVCRVKDWALEDGVEQIKSNYETFING